MDRRSTSIVAPNSADLSSPPSKDSGRKDLEAHDVQKETAYEIGSGRIPDSWLQVAFILVTSLNSAYILGYSKLIMSFLGWGAGVILVFIGGILSLHNNALIANLHEVGGKRHIRYRDLAGHIYGRNMYWATWILQYANLFTINAGYTILAGQALKSIYVSLSTSTDMKLPYWIVITGIVCFAFAFFIPQLSALRVWLGVSATLTAIYIVIVLFLSMRDGYNRTTTKDYTIHGTKTEKLFNVISAIANISFIYNTGMLPELQATLREPAIRNMHKALYMQFTAGNCFLYLVMFIGYWAYGEGVSAYLLNDASGSKIVMTIANIAVFLQTIISLHVFASPMYEFWDTKFARKGEGAWSLYNMLVRVFARGGYLGLNTLVAALLPFLGDFTNLTGALSVFPLSFVLCNHMYLKVKGDKMSAKQRWWHWFNVTFFSAMAVAATVAAIRLIVVDSKAYSVFANI
ncbi:hypothetical protein O6H91_17G063300 [Diphasiastrum complanatum]|uniref:Uncharacterized protein n=1 Tax=Diphasiastrum complanatum TaxID=34168 RepID=A0ACC2B7P3_DIPCM|nr:hypothetical protein O6H91_17G063300 [Diphasiastrum complanatum]